MHECKCAKNAHLHLRIQPFLHRQVDEETEKVLRVSGKLISVRVSHNLEKHTHGDWKWPEEETGTERAESGCLVSHSVWSLPWGDSQVSPEKWITWDENDALLLLLQMKICFLSFFLLFFFEWGQHWGLNTAMCMLGKHPNTEP